MNDTGNSDLLSDKESAESSVRLVAQQLGVSVATIRNWVKSGDLISAGRRLVTQASVDHFLTEISGKEKLNQRANKSQKDSHDRSSEASVFIQQARSEEGDLLKIGEDYESSLSDSYRNKEGIYYTPPAIIDDLFSVDSELDVAAATFCDPCCGSGNFIVRALELGFKPENIYAYDVDPVAVEITRARIFKLTGYTSTNILLGNFLDITSQGDSQSYNYIYTNPPWGKKLPKDQKTALGKRFESGSSVDTCSLFFFACLECLASEGKLGMLLPGAFFNISSFEDARRKALELRVDRLVDYGKAFKGLLTTAQGIELTNLPAEHADRVRCESSFRHAHSFASNPKSIFNLNCDHQSAETLAHLFSLPHITLDKQAFWGLGIVTGNNKKFIKDFPTKDHIPVFRGADVSPDHLSKPSCFIPNNFSLYQQSAPRELYESEEKLIYKFISSRLCFYLDTEQRYLLNSANMMIPSADFPVSARVLSQLLSSDFMNWVFSNIFDTHKILRGDLEALPIHSQFLREVSRFDEQRYLKQLNVERTEKGSYQVRH